MQIAQKQREKQERRMETSKIRQNVAEDENEREGNMSGFITM